MVLLLCTISVSIKKAKIKLMIKHKTIKRIKFKHHQTKPLR